jgi:hypothetical protein
MWLITAVVGLLALVLPGAPHTHVAWTVGLAAFAMAWGAASLYMGLTGRTMPIDTRAVVTATMMPVVALALWATGGANSFLQPVMIFTALFVGYFFEPRYAWPLIALFVFAYASPLLYDARAVDVGYPWRALTFAFAVVGAAVAVQFLKRRLLRAEAHQRTMAERDPLTGLANRRAFDVSLEGAVERCALVVFDFDGFKAINDTHGHPSATPSYGPWRVRATRWCARAIAWRASVATSLPWWRRERARTESSASSKRWAGQWMRRSCPTESSPSARASPGRSRPGTPSTGSSSSASPISACSSASVTRGVRCARKRPDPESWPALGARCMNGSRAQRHALVRSSPRGTAGVRHLGHVLPA